MAVAAMREWVPRPIRRAGGRVRATFVRREILTELQRVARSGRPVIAGPWLGEVGFEILYWIPFLRWVVTTLDLDPARVLALSRGGPSSWYHDVATRYVDVFDHMTLEAFRTGNDRRRIEVGEQKQVRDARFERDILDLVRHAEHLADAEVLPPSLMYRLFQPYWFKHEGPEWVARHSSYATLGKPALPDGLAVTPGEYFAVKFYFNDCVRDDDRTRRFASAAVASLAEVAPVVSLSTDFALDDHAGADQEVTGRVTSIADLVGPRNNLAVQTAVVAHARAFVGTYGGFSYLAPFHHVPSIGVYALADGFDRAHLTIAQQAFASIGAPPFEARSMTELSPGVLARRVRDLKRGR